MQVHKNTLNLTLRLVVFLLAAFGLSSQSYAVNLMALETFDNNLYRIDTDNLVSPEFLGVIAGGPGPDLSELVPAGPNKLYTLDRRANTLWTISLDDLSNPLIVPLDRDVTTHPRGLDMSPAGGLYGVFGMQLYSIAPATGTTTFIANITQGIEAIAFAPDGTLYAAGQGTASNVLYTLNITTGVLSRVGTIRVNGNPVTDIDTLVYASDGYLYGADSLNNVSADLIRIDPATAVATVVGNTGVTGLNGLTEYIEPALTVTIDIKPGSDPNAINLNSQGVVPVAILTTEEFDAATVDPVSVLFADAAPVRWAMEDVDYDGDVDLILHFDTQGLNIDCGITEAHLTGETSDGVRITGADSIKTVGCKQTAGCTQ